MKIISWNINGIRAIMKKNFISFILEEKPDILCVQETKIQEDTLTEEIKNIEGYFSYFSFALKKGYSGVGVYTKEKPLNVTYGFGNEKFDSEGRVLIVEYSYFTILNIYFPNGQRSLERLDYKMEFYKFFLNFANDLVQKGKRLIICGDHNIAHQEIDLKNPKSNENTSGFLKIERDFLDEFIKNGYTDTYRYINKEKVEYSWWSYLYKGRERNTGWRIDYHFVSNNLINEVKDAKILTNVLGSDHCPVVLEL